MLAITLALLLVPMVREGRRHGRSRGVFVTMLVIALVVPLSAVGIYAMTGNTATLAGVPRASPVAIDDAIADLRQRLAEHPDDVEGWLLLGQTYGMLKQPAEARQAFDGALKARPDNPIAMVGWAEADSLVRPDHRIEGRAADLLQRAVTLDPQSQRGLWLLGISQFQHGQYAQASATWKRLQPMLDPDSGVARAVAQQIAQADELAGTPKASAPPGTQLTINVSLAESLRAKLAPGDTLFVFARLPNGPPMPLAVARLSADTLPTSVTLSDAMAMTPDRPLSSAPRVTIAARISHSGQAIAQPGDLEGDAGVVDTTRTEPVTLVIDRTH
nr:tetratricopeptide repeat protein [Luteibacter sp. Sphag1AF]